MHTSREVMTATPDPDSDAAFADMLACHPGLLDSVRAEADALVIRIRAYWWAPHEFIRWKLDRFSERLRAANAPPPSSDMTPRDGALVRKQNVTHLRIYKEAVSMFSDLLKQCERGPGGSKLWAAECQREMDAEEHRQRVANWPKPGPLPPFDARGFVVGLASRGVMLIADADGGLSAMSASQLTEQDRAAIRAHRAAVAGAAASLAETF